MSQPKLDEEAHGLLRRIVEANAWRQYMGANILGHCLKMVGDLEGKRSVLADIELCLDFYTELEVMYTKLGGANLDQAVRDRLLNVPMPSSRFELGLSRYMTDRAQRVALAAYVDSICLPFAELAKTHLARRPALGDAEFARMAEFCSSPANRPRAQQAFDQWLTLSLLALGRPDSQGDRRVLEMGLRRESSAVFIGQYLTEMGALAKAWGLVLPEHERLPLELPKKARAEV
jgi:1,2-phenylacetyl-CoA epoxidase catalytic subunit